MQTLFLIRWFAVPVSQNPFQTALSAVLKIHPAPSAARHRLLLHGHSVTYVRWKCCLSPSSFWPLCSWQYCGCIYWGTLKLVCERNVQKLRLLRSSETRTGDYFSSLYIRAFPLHCNQYWQRVKVGLIHGKGSLAGGISWVPAASNEIQAAIVLPSFLVWEARSQGAG